MRFMSLYSAAFILTFSLPVSAAEAVDRAADDYAMASWLFAHGRYDLACDEFRDFINKYPKHEKAPEAELFLGRSLLKLEKYEEAVSVLKSAGRKYPLFDRMPEIIFELARAEAGAGRKKKAAELFAKLSSTYKDHYLAQWAREREAAVLMELGKYEEAERILSELIRDYWTGPDAEKKRKAEAERLAGTDPKLPPSFDLLLKKAWINLGVAQLSREKFKEAQSTFLDFLKRFPGDPLAETARFDLAQSHYNEGSYEKAASLFRKLASGEGGKKAEAAFLLGLCFYQQERYREAAETFSEFTRRFPGNRKISSARLYAGMCLYLAEDFQGAVSELTRTVQERPRDAEALYWLGMAQLRLGKHIQAIVAFEKAGRVDPEGPRAADSLLGTADALLGQSKWEKAARTYRRFFDLHPQHPEAARALYSAAAALHRAGAYEESEKTVDLFLTRSSSSELLPSVLFLSGENRFLLKRYPQAAQRFTELTSRFGQSPDAPAAFFRLGWIYYYEKKYDQAISHLEKAAAEKGKTFVNDAVYLLGACLYEKGDFEKAVLFFDRYLNAKGAERYRREALFRSALALKKLKRYGEAEDRLVRFLGLFPTAPLAARARYERAEILRKEGSFGSASRIYESICKDFPEHELAPYALYNFALCYYEGGRWSEAATLFGRCANRYPKSKAAPRALYRKALCLRKSGSPGEARTVIAELAKKYPDDEITWRARFELGLSLEKEKSFVEAARVFEELLKTVKDAGLKEKTLYELAWCLEQGGEKKKAIEAYRRLAEEFPESALAADAFFVLAEDLYRKKQYAQARGFYAKALADAGGSRLNDKILYRLGWCAWSLGDYPRCAEAFDRLTHECPKSGLVADALFQAAESYLKLGKSEEALARLKSLSEGEYPSFKHAAEAEFRLGEVRLGLGLDEEALGTFLALERRKPGYPDRAELEFNIGKCLYNLGRYAEAYPRFDKVLDLAKDETAAKAQFFLGETFFAEGKTREALKAYLRVIALWGAYEKWAAAAQYETARVYLRQGEKEKARKALEEVVARYPGTEWAKAAREKLAEFPG